MKQLVMYTLVLIIQFNIAKAQRVIVECTIKYNVAVSNTTDTAFASNLQQTSKIVFVKGNTAKVEIKNPNYYQATIYDKTTGKASVIRELGSNKFLTQLSANQWKEQNIVYNNSVFTIVDSTKKILGYDCKMATITFENSPTIKLFYIPTLILSVKESEWQFKDVPGIVLQYQVEEKNSTISYTASNISFSPVPAKTFVIPTKGYRLL